MVTLIWYPTNLPFLDFPTVFGSHEWETDYPDLRGLGEIRRDTKARKNWHPGIPGLTGDHVCGTPEQFLFGAPGYTGPPVVYDADHIPVCCGRKKAAFTTAGVRPGATVSLISASRRLVTSSTRPASVVSLVMTGGRIDTTGARPGATVRFIPAAPAATTAGARPASVVSQIFNPRPEVTAGALPAYTEGAIVPGSWEEGNPGEYDFVAPYTCSYGLFVVGGGGGGAAASIVLGMPVNGSGGGGGGSSRITVWLTAGVTYRAVVGAPGLGDTNDGQGSLLRKAATVYVNANGGQSAYGFVPGAGAGEIGAIGTIKWRGGDGATVGTVSQGGGGGSSAGAGFPPSLGNGNPGVFETGGFAPPGGVRGGNGGASDGQGESGISPGGAGGGNGAFSSDPPTSGGKGYIFIFWPVPGG